MPTIRVNIPSAPHDLVIEPGALESLGDHLRAVAPHDRALLAMDENISETHGARARASLRRGGYAVSEVLLRADERQKSLDAVRSIYDALLANHFDRGSPVIAMGGGIVGDTAGYAAATYLRGVPLIHVPTTLLAMVDASIGGKTGVNYEIPGGQLGKNLIGAFHQPRLVVADPLVLGTLHDRHFKCGMAECIKHGMIADQDLLDDIGRDHARILAREVGALLALIERSARIKISIVERDEHEEGERALLNLGHTFAHAIESMPSLHLKHGEAVAIGLVAACSCAMQTRRIDPLWAEEVAGVIRACLLRVRLPRAAPLTALVHAMQFDKKARAGRLRLVLPVARGRCEIVDDVPKEVIESAWREVGAT
jgi:3-dehydroquinate synthase